MGGSKIEKLIAASPDPARASLGWAQWKELQPAASEYGEAQSLIYLNLFSGSPSLSQLLFCKPEWGDALEVDALEYPRQMQGLQREINQWLTPSLQAADYATVSNRLHTFKLKETLRIATRDLSRLGGLMQIVRDLSNVAEVCVDALLRSEFDRLSREHGTPWHQESDGQWNRTPFTILGVGRLGGQELDYSSDIELLFVYGAEGSTFLAKPKGKQAKGAILTNHQFFTLLCEGIIAEICGGGAKQPIYLVDMGLRPDGANGPLARSLDSYETYYEQEGRTWERMMLIKARPIAGDGELGGEFIEMIQSFRYPRTISSDLPEEVAAIKQRIETEAGRDGRLDHDVRVGKGGIQEIEFITQTLQVLNAGRMPFLQGHQTLPTLEKLVQYRQFPHQDAGILRAAYYFLREVEHRLELENGQPTHTIPTDSAALTRLARSMGFTEAIAFETALGEHRENVHTIYARLIKLPDPSPAAPLPPLDESGLKQWVPILAARGFREPETSAKLLAEFVHGPGHRHRAPKTEEAGMKLVERIIELCPGGPPPKKGTTPHLSDPDRVIARVGSFVTAHGSRAALYELWSNRLPLFDLMLWLTDRSEYLAQLAVRTPDLLDELEDGGHLRRQKGTAVMLTELRRGQKSSRERGIRDNWLIHYVEAEKTRIGLRDILQLSDADEPEIELTALAEAVLQYTLETLMAKHRLKTAPFAVIGLGGLGSREVVYGSDLEIILVVDKPAARLPKLQEMARQWLELLQSQLSGFNVKLHGWPEGQEGPLVSTVQDFDEYFRHRAGLKDLFSLTTARHVAGDLKASEKLWGTVMNVTELGRARPDLAAWSEDWPERLHAMRLELQRAPTDGATDALAIETGTGGLVDVKFIVQSASLAGHWHEPNTARALIRAENDGSIPVGLCSPLRTGYKKLRNVERILRRWSFQAETELPSDLEAQTRVARRCGMETAEAFLADLAETRKSIRAAYNQLMPFSRHRPK